MMSSDSATSENDLNSTISSLDDTLAIKNPMGSLAKKFYNGFHADLKIVQGKMRDIQQHQTVLIESLAHENNKLTKCAAIGEIEAAIFQVNKYRLKLCQIKRTMINLKESSLRLRKEALRIQQIKQRENMKREDQRHKYLAEERSLIAHLQSP